MQNQLFIGDRILTEFVACGNNVSVTQLSGGISKGLWSAKITVGIDASLGHSSARMMRQNVEQLYTSTFITLAPKFTGKFTRWLSTDYRLTFTNNRYNVNAVSSHHSTIRQNLSVTFLPTDQWHIALSAEHYYTRFSTDQAGCFPNTLTSLLPPPISLTNHTIATPPLAPSQNLCIPSRYDQEILSSKCK